MGYDLLDKEYAHIDAHFDYQRWTITCRMMLMRIARGEYEGAHAALRCFCKQPWRVIATTKSPLAAVLPVRIANALEDSGYDDVDSIRLEDDPTLLEIANFGEQALRECRDVVDRVLAGTVLESYFEDELQTDWDLCVQLGPGGPIASGECIQCKEGKNIVSVLEQLEQLSEGKTLDLIDGEIAELSDKIDRLRSARRLLAKLNGAPTASRSSAKPKVNSNDLADAMLAILKEYGPLKPSDLATRVGTTAITAGKISKADARFARDGGVISVA
jgi:hypothetical protein